MAGTRSPRARDMQPPPPGDPPPAPDGPLDEGEFEIIGDFQHPGLELYRDSGDVAALADATFNDWSWIIYRLRSADEMVRDRNTRQRVLVTKMNGPLDILQVQAVCGGGVFEIRGFTGGRLRTRITQEIAGPHKDYNAAAMPAAPMLPPTDARVDSGPSRSERLMLRALRHQGALLEQLATRAAVPPPAPAPAPGGITLETVIALADRLAQRQNPAPEATTLGHVVDAFKEGMHLSRELGGGPEKSTTEILIEKAMGPLERILGAMLTARPVMRRPGARPPGVAVPPGGAGPVPPPAAAEPSSATVIEPETAGDSDPDMDALRMRSAVDALARAITDGREPEAFAESLEDLLSPQQIGLVRFTPDEQAIGVIVQAAGGKYPVLETDAGRAYLAAVLTAIKHPEADEDEGGDETEI